MGLHTVAVEPIRVVKWHSIKQLRHPWLCLLVVYGPVLKQTVYRVVYCIFTLPYGLHVVCAHFGAPLVISNLWSLRRPRFCCCWMCVWEHNSHNARMGPARNRDSNVCVWGREREQQLGVRVSPAELPERVQITKPSVRYGLLNVQEMHFLDGLLLE